MKRAVGYIVKERLGLSGRGVEFGRSIIVMAVLLVVVLLLIGGVPSRRISEDGPSTLMYRKLNSLKTSIVSFDASVGRFPKNLQKLTSPHLSDSPHYDLAVGELISLDSWGREIEYSFSKESFSLRSAGPNEVWGDDDDVVVGQGSVFELK